MTKSFKGTNVEIESVEIRGGAEAPVLRFTVAFTSEDGLRHAHMNHHMGTAEPKMESIRETVGALIQKLKHLATEIHFDGVAESRSSGPDGSTIVGISEVLSGSIDPVDDGPEQG